MNKSRFIEISAEIEQIENEYKVLDPKNPIELERISLLQIKLNSLMSKIKLYKKEGRLSKFKLIHGEG